MLWRGRIVCLDTVSLAIRMQSDFERVHFFFNMKPDFNTMLANQGFAPLTLGLILQAAVVVFAMSPRAVPGYFGGPTFLLCLVLCLLAFFSGALKIGKNASSFITEGLVCSTTRSSSGSCWKMSTGRGRAWTRTLLVAQSMTM